MKQKIFSEIESALEITKDFNKISHVFSKDEAVKKVAQLNQALHHLTLLLKAQDIRELTPPKNTCIQEDTFGKQGALVKIRPCAPKYEDKTYLGFLIGELALGSSITITEDKIQLNFSKFNPAIFVPELGEIIYGCGSWWAEVENEEDFTKDITDEQIENVWYVQLWKKMAEKKSL